MKKYSLIQTEQAYHKGLRYIGEIGSVIVEKCFMHIDTYDTLTEAKSAQK